MAATTNEKGTSSSFNIEDKSVIADMGSRKLVTETESLKAIHMMPLLEEGTIPVPFSISGASGGEATFVIAGPSISAVCDAINLEVRVNGINIGVLAGGAALLAPGVPKLGSLKPISGNLIAGTVALAAGDYSILLRKAWTSLGSRIDADGDGVSLSELGEAGIFLTAENRCRVLDSVETTLGPILGQVVGRILEAPLSMANAVGGERLKTLVTTALDNLGLSGARQQVLDATVRALLAERLASLGDVPMTLTTRGHIYVPNTLHGSVFDVNADGEGAGQRGEIMPGTGVTHVWGSNGTPVEIADGAAQVAGDHGVLTIQADGSYTYTPAGSVRSLGGMEHFGYAVADGAETKKAELRITLDGGLAVSDSANAGIEYQHVKSPGKFLDDAIDYSWAGVLDGAVVDPKGSLTSEIIKVEANTTQDLAVMVDAGRALLAGSSLSLSLEVLKGTGWTVYKTLSDDQLVALLSSGFPAEIVIPDLEAGDYRIKVEPRFSHAYAEGSINVDVTSTVTHLDQIEVSSVFPARGNLFDNDLTGGGDKRLCALAGDGKTCGASVIHGQFGLLVLEADGNYKYVPDSRAGLGKSTDAFVYQVAGERSLDEATLTIEIRGTLEGNPQEADGANLVLIDSTPQGQSLHHYELFNAAEHGDGAIARRWVEAERASHPLMNSGVEQDMDNAAMTALA